MLKTFETVIDFADNIEYIAIARIPKSKQERKIPVKILVGTRLYVEELQLRGGLRQSLELDFPDLEIESMSGANFDIDKVISGDWDWYVLDINPQNPDYQELERTIRALPRRKQLRCLGFRPVGASGTEIYEYGMEALRTVNNALADKLAFIIIQRSQTTDPTDAVRIKTGGHLDWELDL